MSNPTSQDDLDVRLRVMRIVIAAIMTGAAVFLVIVSVLRAGGDWPTPEQPVITYVLLGVALVIAVAYHFIVYQTESQQRRRIAQGVPDARKAWLNAYQSSLIVGAALLDGAVFGLLVAFLLEGKWISIAAAAVCIGFIANLFPTRSGIERWIEEQQEKLRREQNL